MAYELDHRLVVGVASSALFNLGEADVVFRTQGEEAYRAYQQEQVDVPLEPGVAFPFIKRLLSLNDLTDGAQEGRLVEVIVLSHNDPDTGLRVMNSIEHHGIDSSRAVFTQGQAPYIYIPALSISLFLSANGKDVRQAIEQGYPAGHVLPSAAVDDPGDAQVRIAFDFDGVLADDQSEQVMQGEGLDAFRQHEVENLVTPHSPGLLQEFLLKVHAIQKREEQRKKTDPNYKNRLRISLVTARDAPAHKRAVLTLKEWGVIVNDAFFLGGVAKGKILEVLRPHIFFDDQRGHLEDTSKYSPAVHIPFGRLNQDEGSMPDQE
ncbi:5'-nucleotidase [Mycolicibacterium septicum DSM 44393]|uniref:5'-nucleotidase n=1 Tax=Mycolicibacterium septicum DSM 44393 TaxID=1341646 RepID=A0A7X6MN01_9MYCO|nr:5'-nucleotidase [Mycolicibacterium septicum]NKZ10758.1 5'-nucleotidase [Mycolicibacterium septicum DSM 44393]